MVKAAEDGPLPRIIFDVWALTRNKCQNLLLERIEANWLNNDIITSSYWELSLGSSLLFP